MYFETVTFKQWIIWKKSLKILCGSRNLKLTLSFPTVGGILSFPKLCFRSSWGLRTDLASKIRKRRIGILQHIPYPLSLGLLLHWAASPCVPFSYFCLWSTFFLPFLWVAWFILIWALALLVLYLKSQWILQYSFLEMFLLPPPTLLFLSLSEVLCSTNLVSFYCFEAFNHSLPVVLEESESMTVYVVFL